MCSICGMTSSRRWNVSNHIRKVHKGSGEPLTSDPQKASTFYRPNRSWNTEARDPEISFLAPDPKRVMKQVILELEKTLAKRLVEGLFSPQNPVAGGSITNAYNFWSDRDDFFAIGMIVCQNCYYMAPKKWCYPSRGDDKPKTSYPSHYCESFIISALRSGYIENEDVERIVNSLLPQNLSEHLDTWRAGRSIRLRAIEVPDPMVGRCIFPDPQRPNRSMTLEIKREGWISVDATGNDKTHYHSWADKASKNKDIALDPLEVADFLNLCMDATFSFFSVDTLEGTKKYLMALYPADQQNRVEGGASSVGFQWIWEKYGFKQDENKDDGDETIPIPPATILEPRAIA